MILCGTGHRPLVLGGYTEAIKDKAFQLAVLALVEYKPERTISGMAQGWDQAVAEASIHLNIPFIAAVPFVGQESIWPQEAQDHYRFLLSKADAVECLFSDNLGGTWKKYFARDEWMVNHSDLVLALYNGSPKGGTAHTVKYAEKAGRRMINLWGNWMDWKLDLPVMEEEHGS